MTIWERNVFVSVTIVGPDAEAEHEYKRTHDRLGVHITDAGVQVTGEDRTDRMTHEQFDAMVEAVASARLVLQFARQNGAQS